MSQLFAVIPAAGESRRMGRPKLTLPLGDRSVIRRLLDVLDRPEIDGTAVVIRKDDAALRAEVESTRAILVQPDSDPPDMRRSVEHGLDAVEAECSPEDNDGWMLIPADHPMLNPDVLSVLIEAWNQSTAAILVPTFNGRRGHPTFFRWHLARSVRQLPADRGLNALVQQHAADVQEVAVTDASVLTDLDTPADYERLRQQFG